MDDVGDEGVGLEVEEGGEQGATGHGQGVQGLHQGVMVDRQAVTVVERVVLHTQDVDTLGGGYHQVAAAEGLHGQHRVGQ